MPYEADRALTQSPECRPRGVDQRTEKVWHFVVLRGALPAVCVGERGQACRHLETERLSLYAFAEQDTMTHRSPRGEHRQRRAYLVRLV
jgi:hypothetical protein